MAPITVIDRVLADPDGYRAKALRQPFRSVTLGDQTFHGIAEPPSSDVLVQLSDYACVGRGVVHTFTPTLSFVRKSPAGQAEPNYIHSDAMMGDLTVVYYMNPDPAPGDGTSFWVHRPTDRSGGPWTEEIQADAKVRDRWVSWRHVDAKFNRMVLFQSDLYHSRTLEENYGDDDEDARLICVVFGTLNPKP